MLTSGSRFRLPPPPDAAATRAELDQLRALRASRDEEALRRLAWWHAAAPSYRWNQIAVEEALQAGLPVNVASRHLALLHTALADAMVAAWDSKVVHNRQRPDATDPTLRPSVAARESPSYPDEYAVADAVAATMLAEFFPRRAGAFARLAEEAGRSRMLAGAAYPSDITAGATLGRQVAAAVLDRGRRDGTDQRWAGTVPAAPGGWTGTSPVLPQAPNWRPWLLASAAEFRPPAPPANDSPERALDMAQLRAFERTPLSNARALFWEAAGGGLRSHEYWNNHAGRLLLESGRGAEGIIDHRYTSAWLYAAVRPDTDEVFALVLPEVSAAAMQAFLDGFAATLPQGVHAALLLDGAGWHTADAITVPAKVSLIFLPPYAPQLNPVEPIWLYLRERFLSLRLFADLGDIIDGCCDAWNRLVAKPDRIASLTNYPYLRPVRNS